MANSPALPASCPPRSSPDRLFRRTRAGRTVLPANKQATLNSPPVSPVLPEQKADTYPGCPASAEAAAFDPLRPGQTLLQALRTSGIDVPSDCEEGLSGSCEVHVLAAKSITATRC